MPVITNKSSCHGNLVIINGHGVLLLGKPGIGKSSISLELLKRGHGFVADDLVLFKPQCEFIIGSVKPEGFGLLHLREKGLIDLKALFDSGKLAHSHPIHLCYQLTPNNRDNAMNELCQITL